MLAKIIGQQVWVNSRHHQAIKKLGEGLTVSATAPDGVIEGIETASGQVMGVQWHPENLYQTQVSAQNLFHDFLQRSELNLKTISTK